MTQPRNRSSFGFAGSIATHLLAIAMLALLWRHRPSTLRPLHLPGTPQGQHLMLTYSTGGPAAPQQAALVHNTAPRPRVQTPHPATAQPAPPSSAPAPSEAGHGAPGDSAYGDENVRVALPQRHPRPQPDLSSLPHGTAGDVVVDVVIDDTGKVTGTTLVKGLGTPIDTTVLQALRDWTFTPATRNGANIPSEQEILIHYERG